MEKTKSPSLGLVSNADPSTKSDNTRNFERRKLPRLAVSSELVRMEHTGHVYPVVDLSEGGLALRVVDQSDMAVLPVGMMIDGTLKFRSEKIPFKAKVRHINRDIIGMQFENLETGSRTLLSSYLDPVSLGREMKPVPPQEGGPIWYHGPSGTDLQIWRGTDGQFTRFTLCALGSYVQWEGTLSTGLVEMPGKVSEDTGLVRFETMHLTADATPDPGKLSIAKTLLSSSNLSEDVKKWCQRKLDAK